MRLPSRVHRAYTAHAHAQVLFYIDSELATDWNCRKIHDITLSYSFHKVGPHMHMHRHRHAPRACRHARAAAAVRYSNLRVRWPK